MSNKLKFEFMIIAVLVGIFVGRATLAGNNAYEFFDRVVDVRGEIMKHYVENPNKEKMLNGAIKGIVDSLNDPYTTYLSPNDLADFDKDVRGTFSGIGAQIGVNDTNQLMIISPLEDSPAYKAGILAGDLILEVDGKNTKGMTTRDAVKVITGEEGTPVQIKVRHSDGKEENIKIIRKKIKVQTVKGFRRDAEHHWDFMLDPKAGIGYARITQFSDPTADALKKAIDDMKAKGMKGAILDLRFNPGGLLSQAIRISDMFLIKGRIVSTKGRNSPERAWEARSKNTYSDFPLMVLINEYSASASEIVSGALKDNNRAVVVGTRTFGKGSVQQVLALESGQGALKVTTAHYYLPSGRNLHKRKGKEVWGVDPTDGFYVPMNIEQTRKMLEARRNNEVIKDDKKDDKKDPKDKKPTEITPKTLREVHFDLQLADALESMQAKLASGDYKKIGRSNATLQAHVTKKNTLEQRRTEFQKALDKINSEIEELERTISKHGGDPKKKEKKDDNTSAKAPQNTPDDKKQPAKPN